MFNNFYKGKKILITGHTGFKGSWLTVWLSELGAQIIGYALKPPTKPNLFESAGIAEHITSLKGDIRDRKKIEYVFRKLNPEIVFHLAAQPLVRYSYREPVLTYETNVLGTVNLLEACRHSSSVRVIVNVTSDKCYENREWIWGYRENDPLGGFDPYSSSKACAELVTNAYRNTYFNPQEYNKTHKIALSSVRAGNVIGGGDWGLDRLIPDCIKALSKNKTIIIRNPKATRPWQYVLDPIAGYLLLASRMYTDPVSFSGAWNFAPDDENMLTVEEIAKLTIQHWGRGKYIIEKSIQPHESNLLRLDSSKARISLGWKPLYSVHEALERTIKWYKYFYSAQKNKKGLYKSMTEEIRNFSNHL